MKLSDGRFLTIGNETDDGRHELSVSISDDEGKTFKWTRFLEQVEPGKGSFHYPSIIQTADGALNATYSYFVVDNEGNERKAIKHARFSVHWVEQGND